MRLYTQLLRERNLWREITVAEDESGYIGISMKGQSLDRLNINISIAIQQEFEKNGMMCVGRNPESDLVEIVEIPGMKQQYCA